MTIKVLIVDDSVLMCHMLVEIINGYPDLEVVGVAHDPFIAREKIKALNPDVLTLDVEMPRMDGLTFLERLMRLRPMPVVMVSSLTKANAETTFRALELGAVDFVTKPKAQTDAALAEYGDVLADKLRAAARVDLPREPRGSAKPAKLPAGAKLRPGQLIAIGASTGGTEAILDVLCRLPVAVPPILVVQHMPETFTKLFAARLDNLCKIDVSEAQHGEPLRPGHAYIAPGGMHMQVHRRGKDLVIALDDGPLVNRHRPAVDVLFNNLAALAGPNVIGVILTGMGADGSLGLRALKDAGARTLAQDAASSVVFGMPKAAIDRGAVDLVLPVGEIAHEIVQLLAAPKH